MILNTNEDNTQFDAENNVQKFTTENDITVVPPGCCCEHDETDIKPARNPNAIKLDEEAEDFKDIKDDWYKQAKEMTLDKLPAFMDHLFKDYIHDYGTIVHAMGAAAVAAVHAGNNSPQGGITGFQAGCLMWEFIRHFNYEHNECGMRLIDFDKMLYPQFGEYFDTTISHSTWEKIQEKAKKLIEEDETCNCHATEPVMLHWKLIAEGYVPFGWRVKDED